MFRFMPPQDHEFFKVRHSSNFLYWGFAEKYLVGGIYLHSKAWNQQENWGSVCILVSNGPMKLTFLHLNLTFVLIASSIFLLCYIL